LVEVPCADAIKDGAAFGEFLMSGTCVRERQFVKMNAYEKYEQDNPWILYAA
jgi:hypothetical protein